MKILRIYTKLPPLLGGMEKHIYNLTKEQLKNNYVKVIFNCGDKISENDTKINILKFYKIKPQFIGMNLFYLFVVFKLFLKKQKFDIIHIHGDWSSLLFVKLIKKLTSAKLLVFSIHGQLNDKFTHIKLLPKLVQDIDVIFSTGYDTAQKLEELSGKKVIVQPSGINNIFFQDFKKDFEKKEFQIITVANLFPKKNIELVLEIAKELKEYKFVIVGNGSEKSKLEKMIKDNNLLNVNLVGFKQPEEVKKLYQESDVYLLTSFAEGTPTSALEAMACGLPIVSSKAGGLDNIVKEEENGFIIYDFDKNKFIDKIRVLKNNLELRQKIFLNNQKLAKQYKWENVAKNITEIMEQKLNEKS